MIKLLALCAFIAMASADVELDSMEQTARSIMSSIHSEIGGEQTSSNSLYKSLTDTSFLSSAAQELNRTRRDRLEEGVGSKGVTFVSVTKGKKQVNVTTLYGVGAGLVVNVRDRQRTNLGEEVEEPAQQEVDDLTAPIFEQYVNDLANMDSKGDAIRIVIGSSGGEEVKLRDKRDDLRARARGGFLVAAHVDVSRKG